MRPLLNGALCSWLGSFLLLMLYFNLPTIQQNSLKSNDAQKKTYGMPVFYEGATPKLYMKNQWVNLSIKETADAEAWMINYTFKDRKNAITEWKWGYFQEDVYDYVDSYGIPMSMFKPYVKNAQTMNARKIMLEEGSFKKVQNFMLPDMKVISQKFMPFSDPLVKLFIKKNGTGLGFREKSKEIMALLADIPYGIPVEQYEDMYNGGVLVTPQIFLNKYADCDSKGLLAAQMLKSLGVKDIIFIFLPEHVMLGIKGIPGPYEKSVDYKGAKYIYYDVTGPKRLPLGESSSDFVRVTRIEEV